MQDNLVAGRAAVDDEKGVIGTEYSCCVLLRLGNGGPEMQFKTYNGDVSLRRN